MGFARRVGRPVKPYMVKRDGVVVDRATGFTIGELKRIEVRYITGGVHLVQWYAATDGGRWLGVHPLRRDAAALVWEFYREHDTVRYACGAINEGTKR